MTVFSAKYNNDIQTFAKRNNGNSRTFGKRLSLNSVGNTIHEFNNFANPILKFASIINPELIPITSMLGAGLNVAKQGAKLGARFEDSQPSKKHYPRLEKA